jgi:hypothetical protein
MKTPSVSAADTEARLNKQREDREALRAGLKKGLQVVVVLVLFVALFVLAAQWGLYDWLH